MSMADGNDSKAGVASGVFTRQLEFPMREELDILDVTDGVARVVSDSGFFDGMVTVFVPGATGVITCLEYEPGVIADFKAAIERLAPGGIDYQHHVNHDDGNGHSHVRAGLMGPSLTVPLVSGAMTLGTWQQIVMVNCDNRSRERRLVVTVIGA